MAKRKPTSTDGEDTATAAKNNEASDAKATKTKPHWFIRGILLVAVFLVGVHFGGNHYLSLQGYGSDDHDAIDDFIMRDLLPAVNETFDSLMAQYYANTTSDGKATSESTHLRPGQIFKTTAKDPTDPDSKIQPKHPVVMVPGFITGGLEIWSAEKCLSSMFRQAIWGGNSMAKAFLQDKECWLRHVALNAMTGQDPEGDEIKIRPQQGFEAADYFIAGFWIFGKLIQNLADVGYLPINMAMMTYDWRMAYPLLEERDGFFTDLKLKIERMVEVNGGEKAVMIGHSMGNIVIMFFLRWVTESKENGGGGGGKDWVERHIEGFVNIGGPMLGVPKAVSAIVSGEMRETALLGKLGPLLETYLPAKRRKDLIATWASVWAMLPKGGPALWEVGADIPDGIDDQGRLMRPSLTDHSMIHQMEGSCPNTDDGGGGSEGSCPNPGPVAADRSVLSEEVATTIEDYNAKAPTGTIDDTLQFLLDWGGGVGPKVAASRYTSFKQNLGEANTKENKEDTAPQLNQWHNPVSTPLPFAPDMKIYCMYGVGVDTERGYVYKGNLDAINKGSTLLDPPFIIDNEYNDPERNISHGVLSGDGDGSVPLLSLGYMCREWNTNLKLNPSKLRVTTKEYQHETGFSISDPMRAGPRAGEHCDILGNEELTYDILKIATGAEIVEDRIISDIDKIVAKVNSHELGGANYVSNVEPRYQPGPLPP